MTWFIPQLSPFVTHLRCFVCASLCLFLNSLGFIGSTTAFLEFLHSLSISLSLPVLSNTQVQKGVLSLNAGALSHSNTHYLNRHMAQCGCHERSDQSRSSTVYMAWCGCHEILILHSATVLFLTRFCHFWSSSSSFSLSAAVL